jgi:protein-S-isoprenylcysteine O-methyltransferase Ste14
MSNLKKQIQQRLTWIASMLGCFAFLLMAVKVYDVPAAEITSNLLKVIVGLTVIVAAAALLGRLIAMLRQRRK